SPVMRVAIEHEPLSRRVLFQDERSEADDIRNRRGQAPRLNEPALLQFGLELVLREDGQVVEQAQARCEGRRKRQRYGQGTPRLDGERRTGDEERIAQGAVLRVRGRERKHDIICREWVAVGKYDSRAQRETVAPTIELLHPVLGKPGLGLLRH